MMARLGAPPQPEVENTVARVSWQDSIRTFNAAELGLLCQSDVSASTVCTVSITLSAEVYGRMESACRDLHRGAPSE